MKRVEVLDRAADLICGDRDVQYGPPQASLGLIAAYWSAHLDHPVTAADVAVMMAQLKLARLTADPQKPDSKLDAIGYLAIGAELATGRET